jgi:ABC-type sugar transport system ATPase subunit
VLAGLVGAGRSELCRAVCGDLRVRSGEVRVNGTTVRLRNPGDALDAGIAYVPEERKAQALLLIRSVRDNVSLAILELLRLFRFVRLAEERKVVRKYIEQLDVRTPSLEQEVGKLSGGNQQKVVLARWLARNPKLLILDEPTRGIDVGTKAEIYNVIADLAKAGVAIIVVSSELPEVLGIADRIVVMQNGHITGQLERSEASEEAILSLAMAENLADATPATNPDGAES